MREKIAAAAMMLLIACQCGSRQTKKAAVARPATIDAREIVNATGTAAPYVTRSPAEPERRSVSGGTREEDRHPDREPPPPSEPAPAEDDPPIPRTGTAPAEEREVPADLPDGGAAPAPASPGPVPSGPLQDAGNALPDSDAHAR